MHQVLVVCNKCVVIVLPSHIHWRMMTHVSRVDSFYWSWISRRHRQPMPWDSGKFNGFFETNVFQKSGHQHLQAQWWSVEFGRLLKTSEKFWKHVSCNSYFTSRSLGVFNVNDLLIHFGFMIFELAMRNTCCLWMFLVQAGIYGGCCCPRIP